MRSVFLFFLSCCTSLLASAQNHTIEEIDKTVQTIKNNANTYEQREQINTEEIKKAYYFEGSALRIFSIVEKTNIEKNCSWYFVDDKLIAWESDWMRISDGGLISNEKTYHYNNELIAWLRSENSFEDSNSAEFKQKDRELRTQVEQILKDSKNNRK